ncbi:DUF3558 domain-containing protein [Crossiella cryophila]|uniref:DUF3558 domain-containing protein n=1 Tax=Crossiella cryophila TaxID=43355 RepID=UPI00160D47C9|nr:DUF3558 domain-containing protein [Crossiella cryophila]
MAAFGLLAGVVLAGCGATPAPATTTPTSGAATSASSAPNDAPTVPQPELDTAQIAGSPCSVLSTEQAREVAGSVRGEVRESPLGPSCRWLASDTPAKNHFSITVNNQLGGIAQLYARKSNFKVWEPAQVGGYPAVVAMDADARSKGLCRLEIGTAQKTVVAVQVQLTVGAADYANPCPRATGIGEMVVATLKGGS